MDIYVRFPLGNMFLTQLQFIKYTYTHTHISTRIPIHVNRYSIIYVTFLNYGSIRHKFTYMSYPKSIEEICFLEKKDHHFYQVLKNDV